MVNCSTCAGRYSIICHWWSQSFDMHWSLNALWEWCYSINYPVWVGWQVGTEKPARRVSAGFRGRQPKPSPARLSLFRPKAVENKNATGKLLFIFHHPAGRDLDWDYTGYLYECHKKRKTYFFSKLSWSQNFVKKVDKRRTENVWKWQNFKGANLMQIKWKLCG